MPKISIIMPMLNSIKYLKECMDSVVNQTLKDIEIIPVDAGSSDGTLELLEEYARKDSRIRILHSEKKSMGYQYNIGMEAATGDYIGFVESDDYIVENMYETLYAQAEKHQVQWVKSNYYFFMEYPKVGRQLMPVAEKKLCGYNKIFNPHDYPDQYEREVYMWPGIYRTDFIREHDIRLNETPGASYQDTGFVLQSYMYGTKAIYIDEYLYCYRRDNQGSSAHQGKDLLFDINELEYITDIISKDKRLYDFYWEVNYKRAVYHFLAFYKKMPALAQCSEDVRNAVARYREFLIREQWDEFWGYYPGIGCSMEMSLLREDLNKFDYYFHVNLDFVDFNSRNALKKILGKKKVVIFGCGDNGLGILSLLMRLDQNEVVCLCDNDSSKWGKEIMGVPVVEPSLLPRGDELMYLIANQEYFLAIRSQMIRLGINSSQITACPPIMRVRGTNPIMGNDILPVE